MLNDDQILLIEALHDTIVVLTTGERLRVLEPADDIARRVAHWRRRVLGLAIVSADELCEAEEE